MSVYTLSPNILDIYTPTVVVSDTGTIRRYWNISNASVMGRIVYTGGRERIDNGREKVITDHTIYVDSKLSITEDDVVIDIVDGRQFDIIAINRLYSNTHIQIYTKKVNQIIEIDDDSSSSSSTD